MNNNVKFSIIIASYNEGNRIVRTLNSIMNQSYKNYEAIVVDDGSDEESVAILNNYSRDMEWISIINQDHAGVSSARNKGIKAATGDYLIFLDADDYLCEGILQKYADIISNSNLVDIILPNYIVRKEIDNIENKEVFFTSDTRFDALDETLLLILFYNRVYPGAKGCFDIRVIREKQIFMREDLVVCEDIDWFLKVLFSCDQVYTVSSDAYVYTLFDKHSIPTYSRYLSQVKASEYWIKEIKKKNISAHSKDVIGAFFCRTFSILSLDITGMSASDKEKGFRLCKDKMFIAKAIHDFKSNLFYYLSKILGVRIAVSFLNFLYGKVYKNRVVR